MHLEPCALQRNLFFHAAFSNTGGSLDRYWNVESWTLHKCLNICTIINQYEISKYLMYQALQQFIIISVQSCTRIMMPILRQGAEM